MIIFLDILGSCNLYWGEKSLFYGVFVFVILFEGFVEELFFGGGGGVLG